MLVGAAGAVAGLTLTSSCARYATCNCFQGFKLGVCDWTIGKRANPASLAEARQIGLDGVQVDFGGGADKLPLFDPDLQKRFIEEAKKQQMEIASLAMGVLNEIPYKSDPRAERWVWEGINVAKVMKTDIILLAFFGNGDLQNDEEGVNEAIRRLRAVAPKAERAAVTLGIESWLDADQLLDIIQRVGSPAVKVYYDVGNSHKQGYDIYSEIRQLGRHICQVHAKDYDGLYGEGSIDFPRVRAAMDDVGYRGWIVMEGTKMPLGVEESCRYDADYLRTIFPADA
jgi:L-ribulose-5-phosphate 3-epimerase